MADIYSDRPNTLTALLKGNDSIDQLTSLILRPSKAAKYGFGTMRHEPWFKMAIASTLRVPDGGIVLFDSSSLWMLPCVLSVFDDVRFALIRGVGRRSGLQDFADFDASVEKTFREVCPGYIGAIDDSKMLKDVASSGLLQIRCVSAPLSFLNLRDNLDAFKGVWDDERFAETSSRRVLFWLCGDGDADGFQKRSAFIYDQSYASLCDLSSVMRLPSDAGGLVLTWESGSNDGMVSMRCLPDGVDVLTTESAVRGGMPEAPGIVSVSALTLAVNGCLDPRCYERGEYVRVEGPRLSELSSKIQRGTSLSGKDLRLSGSVFDLPRSFEDGRRLVAPPSGYSHEGNFVLHRDDVHYIDNASLVGDGTVRPQVVSEVPSGQERYTVLPEDGLVLLVPRNGKDVVAFEAVAPTIISNNLFIVRLKEGLPFDRRYVCDAMRSGIVRDQIDSLRKPMGKEDLANVVVPVVDEELQAKVIEQNRARELDLIELRNRVAELEAMDTLAFVFGRGCDEDETPEESKGALR